MSQETTEPGENRTPTVRRENVAPEVQCSSCGRASGGQALCVVHWGENEVCLCDTCRRQWVHALRCGGPTTGGNKDGETSRRMQDIGHAIDERIPEGWGFLVMVFPFEGHEGGANYTSTADRKDAIHLMKEFLIKCGAGEDWMMHIT